MSDTLTELDVLCEPVSKVEYEVLYNNFSNDTLVMALLVRKDARDHMLGRWYFSKVERRRLRALLRKIGLMANYTKDDMTMCNVHGLRKLTSFTPLKRKVGAS